MAKINILRFSICYKGTKFDEHCIFACKDTKNEFYNLSAKSSIELYDIFSGLSNSPIIAAIHDLKNMSDVNFNNVYVKNDLTVTRPNCPETYQKQLSSFEKIYVMCQPHFKNKSTKKTLSMDGYALSLFVQCLSCSKTYVQLVSNYLSKTCFICSLLDEDIKVGLLEFQINLKNPERHVIDLKWAKMACRSIEELRSLQYAMSWLSTLGGAFSALGEEMERCAKNAGMISIEQLRLALKLGDEIVIAQCKLYFSLSLIQQGKCQKAKKIILDQYNLMKSHRVSDKKTVNMCKGIWARLKYEMRRRKVQKKASCCGTVELLTKNIHTLQGLKDYYI